MGEVWFRGQSSIVAPAQPGGAIHDFGDGVYLTDSRQVAELYADTRVAKGGGRAEVLSIQLERTDLGRVLDLNKDARWQRFLRTPQVPNMPHTRPDALIRLANENYGRFFQEFTKQNGIRMQNYDTVIGPEYVRGGSQLCILHRNGQASALAVRLRQRLLPVGTQAPTPARQWVQAVPGSLLVEQGRTKGIAGNQAAMAMIGQLIGGAIQSLGDIGIRRRVERELTTTHAGTIERILARGDGVLVIIRLSEWRNPDFNGQRARTLIGVSVEGGATEADAIKNWRGVPRLLAGPANGWRSSEQYAWIDPHR